ncbi:MAG TPA: DUF4129 domain-containing protein [Candidatus Nanopelagicales bacterium]
MLLPLDVPVAITGEQGRLLAERELADPAYRAAEPSLVQRAIQWLVEQVQRVVEQAGEAAPGGWLGILGLVALVVIGVLVVRWRMGPVRSAATLQFQVDPQVRAAEYRARALAAAAQGRWAEAIQQRMAGLVRGAQERGLIDAQPGWTADEVAAALGARMPDARAPLVRAARGFDEVTYGGRPADAETYRLLAQADDLVAIQAAGQAAAGLAAASVAPAGGQAALPPGTPR